jgi:hypothetical protein
MRRCHTTPTAWLRAVAVPRCALLLLEAAPLSLAAQRIAPNAPATAESHEAFMQQLLPDPWRAETVLKRRVADVEDGFWRTASPAALGLDTAALARHRELCERTGADACVVAYRGRIVQEWYAPSYAFPAPAMSTTKSITGLLVGMLVDDGKIPTLDVRVCRYLAEWCTGTRGQVTLRHLLTMTSGLPNMRDSSVGFVADKNAFVRHLTPTSTPGTTWAYSNEGAQLLSPILDAIAGEPIDRYASRRLFEPLGMRNTRLRLDSTGHAWTYADMLTTPRDMARIGVLMAQRGTWKGRRILSAAWIDSATQPSQRFNAEYGLLWWTGMPKRPYFAALGYLDTNIAVLPDDSLVVVRVQRRPADGQTEPTYRGPAYKLYRQFVRHAAR